MIAFARKADQDTDGRYLEMWPPKVFAGSGDTMSLCLRSSLLFGLHRIENKTLESTPCLSLSETVDTPPRSQPAAEMRKVYVNSNPVSTYVETQG